MIRLFAGLELGALAGRLAGMAEGLPGARWIEERNLHLTLRFIGDIDEGLAEEVHLALAGIAIPAFAVTASQFGTFGAKSPHTLWVGIERTPALVRLRDRIESTLVRAGLEPQPRRFMPHVTIARLKDTPGGRLADFILRHSPLRAEPEPVGHFTLFRSHLGRSGAEYEALERYPLV